MRSYSITRIGVALTLAVVVTAMTLTTITWHEAESTARAIEARERAVARSELREVIAAQETRMRQVGRTLAGSEDTRRRLTVRAHYADWRHSQAWTTGILPCSTDGLALYDRDGRILTPDRSEEAMPPRMPTGAMPTFETSTVAGHGHLTFYHPVHADAEGGPLLGYIGVRIDLLPEVLGSRQFVFIDPDSVRIAVPDGPRADMRRLVDQISYQLRPSPYRQHFMEAFWQVNARLVVFVLLTVAGIALLLRNAVARPLQAMARDIDDLNASVDPLAVDAIRAPATRIRELEQVRRSILNYRAHLAEMHHLLELSAQKFEHQAYHDALTGTLNRRAFDEDMDSLGGMRSSDRHALLLFDCDRFKAINDRLGHSVGDDVLRVIACQLQESLRGEDRLYRLGGDEFVTLLPGADRAMAFAVAERCLEKTRNINHRRLGLGEPISLSVGIAVDNGEGLPLAELHRRADMAMYKAKQSDVEKVVSHEQVAGPESDRPD